MEIKFDELEQKLYSAAICDALDRIGFRHQAPRILFNQFSGEGNLFGRCKTTLWVDMYHEDLDPYELELQAVDACKSNEIFLAAAGGSERSGIWGELLSTAAINTGCKGAIIHGGVRDTDKLKKMGFPVFAICNSVYDSQNRQRVVDVDVSVEIEGVAINPGDLVFADQDGVVFIPQEIEEEVLQRALHKIEAENITRDAIREGMKATDAYEKYGVL